MSSGLFFRLHCGEALPLLGQLQNDRTLMFVIALKDKRPTLYRDPNRSFAASVTGV